MGARIRGLLVEPQAEWARIGAEDESARTVLRRWVLPLAAIGPIARAVGRLAFGWSAFGITERPTLLAATVTAIAGYGLALAATLFVGFALAGTAPSFGGARDTRQSLRVAAYAATPLYLAGAFQLVPGLAFLGVFGSYGFYLLYAGAPLLLRIPPATARPFALAMTAAAIITYVIVFVAVGAVSGSFTAVPTLTSPS